MRFQLILKIGLILVSVTTLFSGELELVKNDSTGTNKIIFKEKYSSFNSLADGRESVWLNQLKMSEIDSISMNVFNDTLGKEYSKTFYFDDSFKPKQRWLNLDFRKFLRNLPVSDSLYTFYISFKYHDIPSDILKRTINLFNLHKIDSIVVNKDWYIMFIDVSLLEDINKLVFVKDPRPYPNPFSTSSRTVIRFDDTIKLSKNDSLFVEFYDDSLNFLNQVKIVAEKDNHQTINFNTNMIQHRKNQKESYFKIRYKDYDCQYKKVGL